ncbi:MAG: hypothetical protein ABR537_13760 [Gemmatimonadales bacterium]
MRMIPFSLAMLVAVATPRGGTVQSGGSLQTCLAAAADYSPVHPTNVFTTGTPELDAVFRLSPGEHHAKIGARWIAVDVGSAAPPNSLAGDNALALDRNTVAGVLRLQLLKGFPAGNYRLDVTADGKPWKSMAFQVVPAPAGAALASLAGLMPLHRGAVWTYAFVQEPGASARISKAPPGATLGTDGKVRATVTATVAGMDGEDAHVTWARGGVPFSEEWWRPTRAGLVTVRRTVDRESVVLDPPLVFFTWPAKMGRSWNYASRDKRLRQRYRIWGPVPLERPSGETMGYVVLVEQKTPMGSTTIERDYVPGLGMVRAITITSIGVEMVNREELTLTAGF